MSISATDLQKAKLTMTQQLKNAEAAVLEYAEMCQKANDPAEYTITVALHRRLQSATLK